MIVAIYGPSLVGKTTLAAAIASNVHLPLRNCGEEVRARARALQVSIADLSPDVHRDVDRESVEWALGQSSDCLVEGRFLDHVLANTPGVVFVSLTASLEARRMRAIHRGLQWTAYQVAEEDERDDRFRKALFNHSQAIPSLIVETSDLSVVQCQELIADRVGLPSGHA